MPLRRPPLPVVFRLCAGLLLLSQGGCMSTLTTAVMREALRETVDSLAEAAATDEAGSDQDAAVSASLATDEARDDATPVISEPKAPSLDMAVDQAVAHLEGVGELDAPTQAALLSILEKTSPEDWPAAIDAFAASLEAYRPRNRTPAVAASDTPNGASSLEPIPEPPAVVVEASRPVGPEPEPSSAVEPPAAAAPPEVAEPVITLNEPVAIERAEATPPPASALAVQNACFVSRVRAWGVVDKFPEAVFRPGQDVIVYFELEAPTARHSPAGHTTSIDTIFRLVSSAGHEIATWDFEPIDETCLAPRRDYFARYFLRIPESAAPGPYRLELMVNDLVAGVSSQAHLDLEVRQ